MITAAKYKHNVQECRTQAKQMLRSDERDALERIAQIWERIANVRERHPQLVEREKTDSLA